MLAAEKHRKERKVREGMPYLDHDEPFTCSMLSFTRLLSTYQLTAKS